MSSTTHVILTFGVGEDVESRLAEMNVWLNAEGFPELSALDPDLFDGNKVFSYPLVVTCINYLNLDGFRALLETVSWRRREMVAALICDEHDERWSTWRLKSELSPEKESSFRDDIVGSCVTCGSAVIQVSDPDRAICNSCGVLWEKKTD